MSRILSRRPSHATVVAYLALFVALGGVSYATVVLPANSVGTKQLKDRAVTRTKVAPKLLVLLKGRQGATAPKGDQGVAGAVGAPGAPGKDATPADFAGEPTNVVADAALSGGQCAAVSQFCTGANGWRWRNYGNGYQSVGFWKDRGGVVHLEGVAELTGGAGGGQPAVFVLPAAYRPSATRQFAIRSTADTLRYADVRPDGLVIVALGGAGTAPLDGITFRP